MRHFLTRLLRPRHSTLLPEEAGSDAQAQLMPELENPLHADWDIINDVTRLPEYKEVLTLPGKSFELGEQVRKNLAAVSCTGCIVIFVTPQAYNQADHLSLLQRIRQVTLNTVAIDSVLVLPSVLLMLHDKSLGLEKRAKTKADRKAGQVADTIVLFKQYLSMACRQNASDVHLVIKKDSNSGAVLFRLDGKITFIDRMPFSDMLDAVGAAYTNLAEEGTRSEPTFNIKAMQSCRIPLRVDGQDYKLRWQSTPIAGGVHVIFRVLLQENPDAEVKTLEQSGYAPSHCHLLNLAVRHTVGVIFVVGPAGAGKSTLLKTLMMMVPNRLENLAYSIEDPAEYKMFGVSQISLQRSITDPSDFNPFIPAMRMVLRGDPDMILVGEVRDRESLSLLKLMVQSGHGVMSSLHASNATAVVERLTSEEMGMNRQTLSARDFLSAIVFQQLVPLLCPDCKLPAAEHLPMNVQTILREKFEMDISTMFVKKPAGCPCCKNKGVKGRTVVAEVILPDHEYRRLIREGKDGEAEDYWRSSRTARFTEPDCNGKTALEHGLYKVHQGLIDPLDLERTFAPFEVHDVLGMKIDGTY